MLSTGVNAVATVAPTKVNSGDQQISALTEQVTKVVAHLARDHGPHEIFVAEAVQGHNLRINRASITDVSAVTQCTQPCSCKPKASTEQEN